MRTSGPLPHIDVMQDLFAKFCLLCFVGGILGGLYDATGLRESDERKQRARDNRKRQDIERRINSYGNSTRYAPSKPPTYEELKIENEELRQELEDERSSGPDDFSPHFRGPLD